ncbi:MAG: TonB family protein, partial [Pseudomonadota bacterium]
MPEYSGGMKQLMLFLQENINYPSDAKEKNAQGKAFVTFTIDSLGKIKDPVIIKSSGFASLDKEAIRVVSIMPNWVPGKKDGKPVPVNFNMPINFHLSNGSKTQTSNGSEELTANDYYNAGVKEFSANNFSRALMLFDQCLSLNSKDVDALYNKGAIYLKQKDIDKACKEWYKIKTLGKTDADQLVEKYCKDSLMANKEIFTPVEKMPEYPGGMQKLMQFLQANIKLPKGVKSKDLIC